MKFDSLFLYLAESGLVLMFKVGQIIAKHNILKKMKKVLLYRVPQNNWCLVLAHCFPVGLNTVYFNAINLPQPHVHHNIHRTRQTTLFTATTVLLWPTRRPWRPISMAVSVDRQKALAPPPPPQTPAPHDLQ